MYVCMYVCIYIYIYVYYVCMKSPLDFEGKAFGVRKAAANPDFNLLAAADWVHVFRDL